MTEGCSGYRSECWASEVRGEWNRPEDPGSGCLWGRQAINVKEHESPEPRELRREQEKNSKVSDMWSFFTFLLSRMILLSLANVTRNVLFCGKTA